MRSCPSRKNASLKELSYYKTGGICVELFEPESIEDVQDALQKIAARSMPFFLLGAGSNSLVMDTTFLGAVISFHKLKNITRQGERLIVFAGVTNQDLCEAALSYGLSGLGWIYGLPGQVGATVRMNARCYGGEISQVVSKVTTVDTAGRVHIYDKPQEIFRGYKDTIFMNLAEAIVAAEFSLQTGDATSIKKMMDECFLDRTHKAQYLHPSCGCVFKNNYDVGVPSGMLLEASNVASLNQEKIICNPKHANFVFNLGASSLAILQHTLAMRDLVYAKFGVYLDYEMEILGTMPEKERLRFCEKKTPKPIDELLQPMREKFQGSLIKKTFATS